MFWVALVIPFFWFTTPMLLKTVQLYCENQFGILQLRYADGEITTDEYEQRKTRIERDLRDPKFQPLSGVPLDQEGPA